MTVEQSPAIAARMLGHELTKLRNQVGLNLSDVDARLPDMSVSKLSRLERGEGAKPKIRDIEALLETYDADEETVASIMALTNAAREAQRWFNPGVLPKPWRPLMALEESAVRHRDWECQHVPGLLQTEAYARAILETNPDASPEDIEHRLHHRMSRQSALIPPNPVRFWALLDEDVLHRPVGGVDVMQAQLARLTEMGKRPNVTIQVVPRNVGAHGGMCAGFMVLDFAEGGGSPAVYLTTMTGGWRTSQSAEVSRFDRLWEQLRTLSLNPTKSLKLINEAARDL
jgi:transcriptional regulator with XRE-family HTH domain